MPYVSVTNGSDAMFNAVKDGELPIGWINEDLGYQWGSAGIGVKLIYPSDVVTIQMDAYGLVKNGPNPKLAKIFLEFLGTKEVHEVASQIVKRRSVRNDVEPPGGLPELEGLNLYYASEPRDVVTDRFNAIIDRGK
jgi:iron(III) transport system substrate-binding protein